MAEKDQFKSDEETVKPAEVDVTELDDNALEEASGGVSDQEALGDASTNGNCLC